MCLFQYRREHEVVILRLSYDCCPLCSIVKFLETRKKNKSLSSSTVASEIKLPPEVLSVFSGMVHGVAGSFAYSQGDWGSCASNQVTASLTEWRALYSRFCLCAIESILYKKIKRSNKNKKRTWRV